MDQCKNCVVRGDIKKCAATECAVHDSWFVAYLCKTLLDCEKWLGPLAGEKEAGNGGD